MWEFIYTSNYLKVFFFFYFLLEWNIEYRKITISIYLYVIFNIKSFLDSKYKDKLMLSTANPDYLLRFLQQNSFISFMSILIFVWINITYGIMWYNKGNIKGLQNRRIMCIKICTRKLLINDEISIRIGHIKYIIELNIPTGLN